MNSEDDIIDLILSGQNVDDLIDKDDDEPIPETPSSKVDDKNKNIQKETPLPTSPINESNNDIQKNIPQESSQETKDEKEKEIKKENEEKIKETKTEEKAKKDIAQEQIIIDEKFPQFKNPLDFVKYLEIDRVSQDILKEMQSFILENHIKKDNKYEVSEINSLLQINNEIMDIDYYFQ